MAPLPKHLRPKWRYLAVGIESWPDATIGRDDFQRRLWYSAQNLIGDPGSADLDLSVFRFRFDDGTGETVVRTRRDEVERARAVLACIDAIDGDPVGIAVRGVSGTVRACEEKYLGRGPEKHVRRDVVYEGAERSAIGREDALDVRTDGDFVGATELDIK